jgi:hypothetical protein
LPPTSPERSDQSWYYNVRVSSKAPPNHSTSPEPHKTFEEENSYDDDMKFVEASLDHVTTNDESESEGQDPSEEYEGKASGVFFGNDTIRAPASFVLLK